MSKFNKIEELKENFDDNLYQSNEFKHTKGLFRNFKKYYEKNFEIHYTPVSYSDVFFL